jgi:alpha-ketoglutarate-dependent 2,4-dichlorophenoxyacetate dioxygenase
MALTIKELHPVFAAEASGLKIGPNISADMVEEIEDLMARYAVLVLRDQNCTDEEQIEFARLFGPRETPAGATTYGPKNANRLPRYLFDAGNIGLDGNILPLDSERRAMRMGDRLWHSDSSFNPLPTKWSMLSGRVIPPAGGNTDFADARAAYDSLSDEMKRKLEGLVAEHSIWHSRVKGGMKAEMIGTAQHNVLPPVYQPVVRTIPRSNRRALMVGSHAGRIPGMPTEEGRKLLEQLTDHVTQPKYVYSHAWKQGDLVMWDNRCTLHRATPFDDTVHKRDMRRTTVDEFAPSWAMVG